MGFVEYLNLIFIYLEFTCSEMTNSTFNLTFAEVKLLPWEIWHENERVMSETFPTFERILGYE